MTWKWWSFQEKTTTLVSFRVTDEEHKQLKKNVSQLSVSAFLRQCALGDKTAPRKKQYTRKQHQSSMDAQTVARLLGTLGQSELGPSMIAIALATQSGSMPVTSELKDELHKACDDINVMCNALVIALRIKRESVQ